MATQTAFQDGQYKEFHSPDICAVCHQPAVMVKVVEPPKSQLSLIHRGLSYTSKAKERTVAAAYYVGHADSSPLPKTGKYARRLAKGTGKAKGSKVYKMVALGCPGTIPGGDIRVKLCEKHAAMRQDPRVSPAYHDPATANGYQWWFHAGQLPLWGKPYHEIRAEEEAREQAAIDELLKSKREAMRQAVDRLDNPVLMLPARAGGPFYTPCGRCGAVCDVDPALPCGQIRCEDCKRHIDKRYARMHDPKFARNGWTGGMWYAQTVIKSGPVIELPAEFCPAESENKPKSDNMCEPKVELNRTNVWISYPTAPDAFIRAALKAAGMRYSKTRKAWWIRVGFFGHVPELQAALPKVETHELDTVAGLQFVDGAIYILFPVKPSAEMESELVRQGAHPSMIKIRGCSWAWILPDPKPEPEKHWHRCLKASNDMRFTDMVSCGCRQAASAEPKPVKRQATAGRYNEMQDKVNLLYDKYQKRPARARAVARLVHSVPKGSHPMSTAKRKLYDVTIVKAGNGFALKFYHNGHWEQERVKAQEPLAEGLRRILAYLGSQWSILGFDADLCPIERPARAAKAFFEAETLQDALSGDYLDHIYA